MNRCSRRKAIIRTGASTRYQISADALKPVASTLTGALIMILKENSLPEYHVFAVYDKIERRVHNYEEVVDLHQMVGPLRKLYSVPVQDIRQFINGKSDLAGMTD